MTDCAVAADKAGLDSLWITEHIAIPPDDVEGSGGRYLDPLITLSYLAARTERIKLGVGIGWIRSEFKALGLNLRKRATDSERVLRFLHEAFENHIVSRNDQPFIFDPRPVRPTILMGGAAPHAIRRAVKFADGWMPMALKPKILAPLVEDYREQAATAGKPEPEIVVFSGLPLANVQQCEDRMHTYREAGATTLVHGQRYEESSELIELIDRLGELPSS